MALFHTPLMVVLLISYRRTQHTLLLAHACQYNEMQFKFVFLLTPHLFDTAKRILQGG